MTKKRPAAVWKPLWGRTALRRAVGPAERRSGIEFFGDVGLNLVHFDVQSGGQLAEEEQFRLFQQGGVVEAGLLALLGPFDLLKVQALGQAGQLEAVAGLEDLVAALFLIVEVHEFDWVYAGQRVDQRQRVIPAHHRADLHLAVVPGGVKRRVLHVQRAEYVVNARETVEFGLAVYPAYTGCLMHN